MRAAMVLFFFQAEGGIEDVAVTGVQTCALPISGRAARAESREEQPREAARGGGAGGGRGDEGRGRRGAEIGRAACGERGEISGGAASLKKKTSATAAAAGVCTPASVKSTVEHRR